MNFRHRIKWLVGSDDALDELDKSYVITNAEWIADFRRRYPRVFALVPGGGLHEEYMTYILTCLERILERIEPIEKKAPDG